MPYAIWYFVMSAIYSIHCLSKKVCFNLTQFKLILHMGSCYHVLRPWYHMLPLHVTLCLLITEPFELKKCLILPPWLENGISSVFLPEKMQIYTKLTAYCYTVRMRHMNATYRLLLSVPLADPTCWFIPKSSRNQMHEFLSNSKRT